MNKKELVRITKYLLNEGFCVDEVKEQENEHYCSFGKYTPAGEDWYETIWFDGSFEDFKKQVEKRYCSFDVDDEVTPYVQNRGTNGIPSSIRELLEDAEWKEEQLKALVDSGY